jgi:hypothetical protein
MLIDDADAGYISDADPESEILIPDGGFRSKDSDMQFTPAHKAVVEVSKGEGL